MDYTFRNNGDKTVTVQAETEEVAKDLAMFKLHGGPDYVVLFRRPYQGYGLRLVETK